MIPSKSCFEFKSVIIGNRLFLLLSLSILLITIFISANCQDLYFPSKGNWEAKLPSDFNYNSDKIQKAIDFVIANQNNGDKDLRVEILKGFSTEPYHSIKGPTKKEEKQMD